MIDEKTTARFWSKVDKNGPTVSHVKGLGPCWAWKASTNRAGYGRMGVGGRMLRAHRISWAVHNGPIPEGVCVCHRCDTRLCVNPAHLFLGTQLDNMRDRDVKKRHVATPGEQNGAARLTAADVLGIRAQYAAGGISQQKLGERFGVSQSSISCVLLRETWAHVAA